MRMFKKSLALVLILSLVAGCGTTAFAGNAAEPVDEVIIDNDGTYILNGEAVDGAAGVRRFVLPDGSETETVPDSITVNTASNQKYGADLYNIAWQSGVKVRYYPDLDAGIYDVYVYAVRHVWTEQTQATTSTGVKKNDVTGQPNGTNGAYGFEKMATCLFTGEAGTDWVELSQRTNYGHSGWGCHVDAVKFVKQVRPSDIGDVLDVVIEEDGSSKINENDVDTGFTAFNGSGNWTDRTGDPYHGGKARSVNGSTEPGYASCTYYPVLDAGSYTVYVHRPGTTNVYATGIEVANSTSASVVNYGYHPHGSSRFEKVGTYTFSGVYGQDWVKISARDIDNTGWNTYFDAVKFEKVGARVSVDSSYDEIQMHSCKVVESDSYAVLNLNSDYSFSDGVTPEMFTVNDNGRELGVKVSRVEKTSATSVKLFFDGTEADGKLKKDITEDMAVTVSTGAAAVEGDIVAGNVTVTLKTPDKLKMTVTGSKASDFAFELENTWNAPRKITVLIIEYKGTKMVNSIETEFDNFAVGDKITNNDISEVKESGTVTLADILSHVNSLTGPNKTTAELYIWSGVPSYDEETIEGGEILAGNKCVIGKSSLTTDVIVKGSATAPPEITTFVNTGSGASSGISIAGTAAGSKRASIYIYKKTRGTDTQPIKDFFREAEVADNGSFNCSYSAAPVEDTLYIARITTEGGQAYSEFTYCSDTYRNDKVAEAKLKSESEFAGFVTDYRGVLCLDMSNGGDYGKLSARGKTKTMELLYDALQDPANAIDEYTELQTKFNEIVAAQKVVDAFNAATEADIIAEIESDFAGYDVPNNEDWTECKDKIAKLLSEKEFNSEAEIIAGVKEGFYTTVFNNIGFADEDKMLARLTLYKTELSIPAAFFDANQTGYVKYMVGKTFTSAADIASKTQAAITQYNIDNPVVANPGVPGVSVTPGFSGGATGGGGGGGGAITTLPKENTQSKEPIVTADEANAAFKDVLNSHWAKTAVEYLAKEGIISGNGDGMFEPEKNVTRAEFVKMIVMAFGEYDKGLSTDEFADVNEGDWFYPYVANAVKRELVTGDEKGNFNPNDNITREDMCVILQRQLGLKTEEEITAEFTDSDAISEYAKEAVAILKHFGIVNGMDDGSFAPQRFCTRAMAAQIIYNALVK